MMIYKLKFALLFGILILVSAWVSAAMTIDIDVDSSFRNGETVDFNYTLTSDVSQVVSFVSSVRCPNAPESLLELNTEKLSANVPFTNSYSYILIDETTDPQGCTALVSIIEPYEMTEAKRFNIVVSKRTFSFNLLFDEKVILKDEEIEFDYTASVDNLNIFAVMTYPDKTTTELNLPTSMKVDQVGTYKLDVTASRQGYKDVSDSISFGVIRDHAEVFDDSFSGESVEKANLGSRLGVSSSSIVGWLIVLALVFVLLVVVAIFIIFKLFRRKNNMEYQER